MNDQPAGLDALFVGADPYSFDMLLYMLMKTRRYFVKPYLRQKDCGKSFERYEQQYLNDQPASVDALFVGADPYFFDMLLHMLTKTRCPFVKPYLRQKDCGKRFERCK